MMREVRHNTNAGGSFTTVREVHHYPSGGPQGQLPVGLPGGGGRPPMNAVSGNGDPYNLDPRLPAPPPPPGRP